MTNIIFTHEKINEITNYLINNQTKTYIDVLPDLVQNYNNTVHSTIKMTPCEALERNNRKTAKINFNNAAKKRLQKSNVEYKVNSKVRVLKETFSNGPINIFEKSYVQKYSNEIYTIHKVIQPKKLSNPQYILKLNGKTNPPIFGDKLLLCNTVVPITPLQRPINQQITRVQQRQHREVAVINRRQIPQNTRRQSRPSQRLLESLNN